MLKNYFKIALRHLWRQKWFSLIINSGLAIVFTTNLNAQVESSYILNHSELYNIILKQDNEFFEAYNNCDLEKQASIYSDTIEFFHDKGGYMNSKNEILESTKKYICGKITRELIKDSLQIHAITDYGAVEIGYHNFKNNQEPNSISTPSKFIIIWKEENNTWKITKVISLH